jgi:hypothetical protein
VDCPSGYKVVGGGFRVANANMFVYGSEPLGETTWRMFGYNYGASDFIWVFALCLDIAP